MWLLRRVYGIKPLIGSAGFISAGHIVAMLLEISNQGLLFLTQSTSCKNQHVDCERAVRIECWGRNVWLVHHFSNKLMMIVAIWNVSAQELICLKCLDLRYFKDHYTVHIRVIRVCHQWEITVIKWLNTRYRKHKNGPEIEPWGTSCVKLINYEKKMVKISKLQCSTRKVSHTDAGEMFYCAF